MKKNSLLIIDDEPDNFDVIETLLLDRGYELHYASSGSAAIASLDTFQPDLILLDVMMPGIDGIRVCQQIKGSSKWHAIPIIMVTALSSKEDLARCMKAGADDFISKPVNGLELNARVHSMLRIKQQYDHIQHFSNLQQDTINLLRGNLKELRGNLALSLPHELNTPLNGISGAIKLLLDDIHRMDSASIYELLDLSYQSARRLEDLIQKFLNYLSLELTGAAQKEIVETSAADHPTQSVSRSSSKLIDEIAVTTAQQRERLDDLTCQIQEADLLIPQTHLTWIVSELLDNAFKFSQPQTPIVLQGVCWERMFHLWIEDQGRGMTQEQIASIGAFMQFERYLYEQQGAGLGLRIAQKAVELYDGQLRLYSAYRQRTTAYVTLPLSELPKQDVTLSQEEFQAVMLRFGVDLN